ncbi:hypothetical protein [Peribacillus acanthi]|uniref:hypothetical protein n=1 Tax=Peribacillus acanthi TaxID=2171554 RepID=UPI000D3E752D|nr:hypothetical protein [Peribacillus acanthi]
MSKIIETFKKIRLQKTSINIMGLQLELGMEHSKALAPEHLRELYVIRNILSPFSYRYENMKIQLEADLEADEIDEEMLLNHLIVPLHQDAVNLYRDIANPLLGSEVFLLMEEVYREAIIASFEYVHHFESLSIIAFHDKEDLEYNEEEIEPMVEGILTIIKITDFYIADIEKKLKKVDTKK